MQNLTGYPCTCGMLRLGLPCLLIALSFAEAAFCQTAGQLPAGTRENYVTYRDFSISDEFNSSSLDTTKWGRRNTKPTVQEFHTDPSLVVMEQETVGQDTVNYVSIKATGDDPDPNSANPIRTAGIVSRATGFYGFYALRFRYRGFDTPEVAQNRSIWHPAVWGARNDSVAEFNRSNAPSGSWLEIDFVEWENHANAWSSDAPAYITDSNGVERKVVTQGPGAEKAIMRDAVHELSSDWQTVGLEYSPDHLKLWQWENDEWTHFGDRVVEFVPDDPVVPESQYTIDTIGDAVRTPKFWILGNIVAGFVYDQIVDGTNNREIHDMDFDIDYFRYYRHVDAVDMDWKWEYELSNGGESPLPGPGDFTGEGAVAGSDFLHWQRDPQDALNLNEWQDFYGDGGVPPQLVRAIPEPTGLAIGVAIGFLGAGWPNRRRIC